MTKLIDELVITICGTSDHMLAPLLTGWCAESRRFTEFAQEYASKIRKKVRLARDEERMLEVCAELAVAALLVRDRRCAVAYEQLAATGKRGPDFTVVYRTHTQFHVEVTHVRALEPFTISSTSAPQKLARVVCDKLGQLQTGSANVILMVVPPDTLGNDLLPATFRLLDERAQRQDDAFFREHHLDGVRDFTRQRPRLSGVVLRAFALDWSPVGATVWTNPMAKHPLAPDIVKIFAT